MQRIIKIFFSGIIGGLAALTIVDLQYKTLIPISIDGTIGNILYSYKEIIVFCVMFGLMYITLAGKIAKIVGSKLENAIFKYPMQEILMYIIGFAIGLAIANLIISPFMNSQSETLTLIWCVLLYAGLGYSGIYIVHCKKDEMRGWFNKKNVHTLYAKPKILDTSVIIDGRILDIIKTNFIEGKIVVPNFVLDELRHIADASDRVKRQRGRRGLDMLDELQNLKNIEIEILDVEDADISEVDVKLLRLAKDIQGIVVTNDFNLNKVAKVQKVDIFNINDLSNAIKPIVLPNEEMVVTIIKEGKEQEQGVAYLNDGTMIVVEGGKKHVGETHQIHVTTVLQTSAGRMIFAKIDHSKERKK
ncbi:MAG: PIN/TRAM domain-containing protein [Cellulosilyticaceae bacterium]